MGKFYVYKHIVNGEVKYVGSNWQAGDENRAYNKIQRTKKWQNTFKISKGKYIDYNIEIIEYVEDNVDRYSRKTLEREKFWILYYKSIGMCECNNEFTDNWKSKLRNTMLGRYDGENNPMFGKGEKISGLKSGKSKPVKCIETNEIFVSATDAANKLNCNRQFITDVCKGIRKKHKGYTFMFVDKGELINDNRC